MVGNLAWRAVGFSEGDAEFVGEFGEGSGEGFIEAVAGVATDAMALDCAAKEHSRMHTCSV